MTDSHTPHRPIRVDIWLWDEFGRLAGERNRAAVIRDFIRWYVREPGAQLPVRPESVAPDRPKRPDRNPELTQLLVRARNNLAHGVPQAMRVSSDESEGLLPRELQILFYVAEGLSDAEIAAALKVSPATAKRYIRKVAAKIRAAGQAKIYIPEGQVETLPAEFHASASPADPS